MQLLIIGGTRFVGRAIVEEALAKGHQVTLFNRGKSNPDLFEGVDVIVGDRDTDIERLAGRKWDAVIDTCGYIPRHVRDAATVLKGNIDHYTFISTISVYAPPPPEGIDESAPLATLEDHTVEEVTGETYGGLKVLCEEAIDAVMDGQATHVRAGLIVGPHDMTERWTYWPVRAREGGEMIAPGGANYSLQFIDVRDLAKWTVLATEQKLTGAFNATGPNTAGYSFGQLLEDCAAVTPEAGTKFNWVSESFLLEQEVRPWGDLPLWLPEEMSGMHRVNCSKVVAAGMVYRPVTETITDLLAWHDANPDRDTSRDVSLKREREQEILAAWKAAEAA